jgi:hypothetical protein
MNVHFLTANLCGKNKGKKVKFAGKRTLIKLATRPLQQGQQVSVLNNFMFGYEPIMHLSENPNIAILKRDIRV